MVVQLGAIFPAFGWRAVHSLEDAYKAVAAGDEALHFIGGGGDGDHLPEIIYEKLRTTEELGNIITANHLLQKIVDYLKDQKVLGPSEEHSTIQKSKNDYENATSLLWWIKHDPTNDQRRLRAFMDFALRENISITIGGVSHAEPKPSISGVSTSNTTKSLKLLYVHEDLDFVNSIQRIVKHQVSNIQSYACQVDADDTVWENLLSDADRVVFVSKDKLFSNEKIFRIGYAVGCKGPQNVAMYMDRDYEHMEVDDDNDNGFNFDTITCIDHDNNDYSELAKFISATNTEHHQPYQAGGDIFTSSTRQQITRVYPKLQFGNMLGTEAKKWFPQAQIRKKGYISRLLKNINNSKVAIVFLQDTIIFLKHPAFITGVIAGYMGDTRMIVLLSTTDEPYLPSVATLNYKNIASVNDYLQRIMDPKYQQFEEQVLQHQQHIEDKIQQQRAEELARQRLAAREREVQYRKQQQQQQQMEKKMMELQEQLRKGQEALMQMQQFGM